MDIIPDEVLQIIFEKLPSHLKMHRLSHVCRRWQTLIRSRHLQVRRKDDLELMNRGLITIWVYGYNAPPLDTSSEVIIKAAIQAPRLRELTIHAELWLNIKDFEALAALKHLQHLDVFVGSHSVLTQATCPPPQVTSLVINNVMSKEYLHTLQKQPKLRSLQMYGFANSYPPRPMIKVLAAHKSHLTDLTLRCCELPNAGYEAIALCSALRHLRLYSCWLLRAPAARRLAALRLRTLHLTGLVMVRAGAMQSLVSALSPLLEELNLSASRADDGACAALAARLPALRALELWRCDVTPAGLVRAARSLPLRTLDTDVQLDPESFDEIIGSGSLTRLRCRLDGQVTVPPWLKLRRAGAPRCGGARLRAEGQGPASARFYSWEPG